MKIYSFRHAPTLSKFVTVFFWLTLAINIVNLISYLTLIAGGEDPIVVMQSPSYLQFQAVFGGLGSLISTGLIISFLVWTHRMSSNAHSIAAKSMTISPGWAVGWYFIPFANLIKPYEAIKETYDVLQVQLHQEKAFTMNRPSAFSRWWFFWIFSGVVGSLLGLSFGLTGLDLSYYFIILAITTTMSIVACWYAIQVVKITSGASKEIGDQIAANPNTPPPVTSVRS